MAVAIAAYNAAATIVETLESVLAQTRPPDEIVVCDDGSGDRDQLDIALAPLRGRVQLIDVPHGGESRAKNAAVAATTADVVCILDADDVWEPMRLEALSAAFVERPDVAFWTTDAWHERNGSVVARHYDLNAFPVQHQRQHILERNFVFGHAAIRREAWDHVQGFSEALQVGADWDCWLRLLYSGHDVGLVEQPLARYRLSPMSLSGDRARAMRARVSLLRKAESEQVLTVDERSVLEASARKWERRALLAEAERALLRRDVDVRRRCLATAMGPDMGWVTRVKHAAATCMPGLAASLHERRAVGGWTQ